MIPLTCREYDYLEIIVIEPRISTVTVAVSVLARIWIFFQKKESLIFFRELFAREELSINDENCTMRRANGFETCILHAQNNKTTIIYTPVVPS